MWVVHVIISAKLQLRSIEMCVVALLDYSFVRLVTPRAYSANKSELLRTFQKIEISLKIGSDRVQGLQHTQHAC